MYVPGLVMWGCANVGDRHWSRQDSERSDIFRISFVRLAVLSFSVRRTMVPASLDGPSSYRNPSGS